MLGCAGAIRRVASAVVRFTVMIVRLTAFAALLSPVALRIVVWYLCSPRVLRGVTYGRSFRQSLDVYLPVKMTAAAPGGGAPMLVFVPGGAWLIGHRSWAALLGRLFADRGVVVVVPDYRNFPCGRIDQMVPDVTMAVGYAVQHARDWGADPERVFLAGQSAGAHIAAMALLLQAKRERDHNKAIPGGSPGLGAASLPPIGEGVPDTAVAGVARAHPAVEAEPLSWRPSKLRGFIGISGPYDLPQLREYLTARGMADMSFIDHIMGGKGASALSREQRDAKLAEYSPTMRVRGPSFAHRPSVTDLLPEFTLLHGSGDSTVPDGSTMGFGEALSEAGITASVTMLQGKSHTDPIIEDLLAEPKSSDAGGISVISELINAMHRGDSRAAEAAIAARARTLTGSLRRPSMLVDGLGALPAVPHDDGVPPGHPTPGLHKRLWTIVARVLVALARKANPF